MLGVVGIDPGAKGAIALLDAREKAHGVPKLLDVQTIPTTPLPIGGRKSLVVDGLRLAQLIWGWEREHDIIITHGAVERVAAMPGDHAPQAFAFGRSLGSVSGVIEAQGIDLQLVPVATWRQIVGVPRALSDDNRRKEIKALCRKRAAELWPSEAARFARVKDADAAEAAMIALSIC